MKTQTFNCLVCFEIKRLSSTLNFDGKKFLIIHKISSENQENTESLQFWLEILYLVWQEIRVFSQTFVIIKMLLLFDSLVQLFRVKEKIYNKTMQPEKKQ